MGFGASAARVLHLFSAEGQTRLQRGKNKWDTSPRRPEAGGQRRFTETVGRSTPNAAHVKLSSETAAYGADRTAPCPLTATAMMTGDPGSTPWDAQPRESRLLPDAADTSQQPRRLQPESSPASCSLGTCPLLEAASFSCEVKTLQEDSQGATHPTSYFQP